MVKPVFTLLQECTKFKQTDMENIYNFFTNDNKFTGKHTLAWEMKWTC